MRPITQGAFDLQNPDAAFGEAYVMGVDSAAGWIYFTASPDDATQLYLFRSRLDGSGRAERVTPAAESGTNLSSTRAGRRLAIHIHSTFTTPPVYELVRLPATRWCARWPTILNCDRGSRSSSSGRSSSAQVDIGDGVKLDAWMMKPADFDSTKKYPVLFNVYGEPAAQTVPTPMAAATGSGI